jgi:hypothetical protein
VRERERECDREREREGEREREREGERERDREIYRGYIRSSHLGLTRWRIGTPQEIEAIRDEPSDKYQFFVPQG